MDLRKLNSLSEFNAYVEERKSCVTTLARKVYVCCGSVCLTEGAMRIYNQFQEQLKEQNISCKVELATDLDKKSVTLEKSGCLGFCKKGPLVRVEPEGWIYTNVHSSDVSEIIQESVINGNYITRLGYDNGTVITKRKKDVDFLKYQTRRVLRNCGEIDPEEIDEALVSGEYAAWMKALFELSGEDILNMIEQSGLRGRGINGAPMINRWRAIAESTDPNKTILANDGKSAVGSFMDRGIVEGDPHKLVEGMAIICLACGVTNGHVYIRPEYPVATYRLKRAIEQAEALGLIGDNIMGTGKSFHLHLNEGADYRTTPSVMPIYANLSIDGTATLPTAISNIETIVNVPDIVGNGPEWFRECGTEQSPGTKVYMLTGAVKNNGMIEIPFGMTVREVVEKVGGGMDSDQPFRAMRLDNGSAFLLRENLDMPLTYENLEEIGEKLGSGEIDVMDSKVSMMETAKQLMGIAMRGSCGKCTPCREGMPRVKVLLEKVSRGEATKDEISELRDLAQLIQSSALCFETCTGVATYVIDPEQCIGCTKCARNCPVGAIRGTIKQPHVIDQKKCVKCGTCFNGCPKHAIKENNPWQKNT